MRVSGPHGTTVAPGDPLAVVRQHLARYRAEPRADLPPFTGGFLGYLGYDAVRLWERVPLDRVLDVEKAIGRSRRLIRPDLFADDEATITST